MKLLRLFFLLACLLITGQVFAQIVFKGEMRLGDTSQVHILYAKDGSRLTGRVIGFDQEQLTFLFKNKDRLIFNISEVESVEVVTSLPATPLAGSPGVSPLSPFTFMYEVLTEDNKRITGKLMRANATGFRLQQDNKAMQFYAWKDIDSLVYIGVVPDAGEKELHILFTERGDRFTGYILSFDGSTLRFILTNGVELKFSLQDLRRIELSSVSDETLAKENTEIKMQGHERLYVTPTAFLLEKGQGEFRTIILYNTVDYGVSDNITVGGSFASVIAASLVSLKFKLGGSLSQYLHVAAGTHLFTGFAIGDESLLGALAFGSLTLGTPEKFLSVSLGTGRSNEGNGASTGYSFSGSFRVSKRFRLYGEYLNIQDPIGNSGSFAIAGGSWFNQAHRVDFGIAVVPIFDEPVIIPFPLLSYAYRF